MKPSEKRIAFENSIMKEIAASANVVKDPIKERAAKEANIMKELGGLVKTTFNQVLHENANINELSPELMQRAIGGMKDRGMDQRASRLTDHYVNSILGDFKNKPIDVDLVVGGFALKNYNGKQMLDITYISPRDQEYNRTHGTIQYDIDNDKYYIDYPISRIMARTLSLMAVRLNPESRYKNATANFQIKGY